MRTERNEKLMDNNQTERKSINLSKEKTEKPHVREAYPVYRTNASQDMLQEQEYRNSPQQQMQYREPEEQRSYYVPPVAPQAAQNPPVNYQQNERNLNQYYDNYGDNYQEQPNSNAQNQNMKYCKYCGKRVVADAVICTHCGRQIEKLSYTNNQPQVNNNINVNPQMVQRINPQLMYDNYRTSEKSKSTALILAALGYVGLGGLHRFYSGKVVSGFLYLCTFGFFGLGTTIDIIKIATNTFTDGAGYIIKR